MLISPAPLIGEPVILKNGLLVPLALVFVVSPTEVTVPPVPAAGTKLIISCMLKVFVGFSPLASDVNVPISRSAEVGVA
jgi:hypothetical protein